MKVYKNMIVAFCVVALMTAGLSFKGTNGASAAEIAAALNPGDPVLTEAEAALDLATGRDIFRFDTFGDEAYWGDSLQLHQAIQGAGLGGVGAGVSPNTALAVGLKVDVDALPPALIDALRLGQVNLDDPATTLALLKLDAVLGVKGFFNAGGTLSSIGITCAFCHSTVDDSFVPGIGHRLDGWANRDLNVGVIVSLAPNLQPLVDRLGVPLATVLAVLNSWGPGRYDAELNMDGQAFRPGTTITASTLLPSAFGLAGVNLHTYTGWGSVTYWNAYVAVTQMRGKGTFFDPRLNNAKFPLAQASGDWNVQNTPDLVSSKLPALHLYQLSLQAPVPPAGSFDPAAARRGRVVFNGKADCARCHVPPLYAEPGWPMHTAAEIGIDNFQALRSPDEMYRTTPLGGLWTHTKGGFYHDGQFATLLDVVNHYDTFFGLLLTVQEKDDLVEFLKSLPSPVSVQPVVDYDGDGKTDISVYRASTGTWFVTPSGGGAPFGFGWGGDPTDKPVPGDYDGDGKTDTAIFRGGVWFIFPSGGGTPFATGWGIATDKPVPGDYDGDGKADLAVYRDSTWFVSPSGGGAPSAVSWGIAGDLPVPGDYDGDGKTDTVVYRPSIGAWFIIPSSGGASFGISWGGDPSDVPLTANPD